MSGVVVTRYAFVLLAAVSVTPDDVELNVKPIRERFGAAVPANAREELNTNPVIKVPVPRTKSFFVAGMFFSVFFSTFDDAVHRL